MCFSELQCVAVSCSKAKSCGSELFAGVLPREAAESEYCIHVQCVSVSCSELQ